MNLLQRENCKYMDSPLVKGMGNSPFYGHRFSQDTKFVLSFMRYQEEYSSMSPFF
jgi:hypothetical protein